MEKNTTIFSSDLQYSTSQLAVEWSISGSLRDQPTKWQAWQWKEILDQGLAAPPREVEFHHGPLKEGNHFFISKMKRNDDLKTKHVMNKHKL